VRATAKLEAYFFAGSGRWRTDRTFRMAAVTIQWPHFGVMTRGGSGTCILFASVAIVTACLRAAYSKVASTVVVHSKEVSASEINFV
jgi:hypothetical protein